MGCFSLRSLLLAAIVISNCITWTASRHSYAHNASGHRRRHRRNGADLALPSDYVIPGGESSEAGWGQWGPPSNCSRPCGGGVKSQTRICSTFGPDGQPNCKGGPTKYYSCNTQDCPDTSIDFRAEQCASYNDKVFKGRTYNWVPYTNGPQQCELNCMPKGERFYYRQAAKVIDGTPCSDESFDVCVNGECQPVGCDLMLGSNAREDKCRECRGNGSNCDTIASIYDNEDLTQGYTDILLIPEGATNIVIEEVDKSNNYLALRSLEDNKYYLNGEYQISFPHTLMIAGALWHYERSVQGFAAPDKLRCLGPITEPLYLSLLTQETNVGIKYEYSIRKGLMPQTNAQYTWAQGDFTPCSVTCGTGFRTRNVTCYRREPFEEAEENLCDAALRPLANETCQLAECQPEWVPSPWSPCSKLCGEGSQSRTVQCQKIISNGYPSIIDEDQCFRRLGDKPAEHQKCNTNGTCPTWFTGPWKPCDKLCGDGKQTRQVVCHRKTDGRVEVLVDESCEDEKPEAEQPCNIHPCDGIDWVVANWTGCDSCLSVDYTRDALCVTKDRQVVDKELCSYHKMPTLTKPCDEKELPACLAQWYASQWSKCSAECGVGVKTRKVFCGKLIKDLVEKVDDSKCDSATKYNDTTPCEVPDELCPAKWFTADWSECTKECDGGLQYRKVMCLSGGNASESCPKDTIPEVDQPCNTQACNIDELLSVSSTTVMDDDELPECEEDDEVGAELLTSTSLSDMMFSDAASTSEGSGSSEGDLDVTAFSVTGSYFTETGSGETDSTTESSPTASETDSAVTIGTGSTEAGESSTTATDITTGSDSSTVSRDGTGSTAGSTESVTGSSVSGGPTSSGATGLEETTPSVATGETTPTGASGETTPTDASGATTPTGASGETTPTSVSVGITPTGTSGETTPTGVYGETTPTGASGETTPTGASGETTPSGVSGETTPTGASGETTPTGASVETTPTGASGETTPTDASGATTPTGASGETTTAGSSVSTDADTSSTSESSPTSDKTTEPSSTSDSTTSSSDLTETSSSGESTTSSADTSPTADSSGLTTTDKGATKAGVAPPTMPTPSTTGDSGSSTTASSTDGSSTLGSTPTESTGTTITAGTSSSSLGSSSTGDISGTTSSEGATTSSAGSSSTSEVSGSSTSEGSTVSSSGSSTTSGVSGSSTSEDATSSSPGSGSTGDTSGSASSEDITTGSSLSTTAGGSTSEGSSSSDSGSSTTAVAETGSTGTGSEGTTTDATSGSETTTESGDGSSTTDDGTTESDETTPWDLSSILSTNKPRCRPRNKPAKCTKSKFGCCPDKKTAAGGPFDEGCPSPTTCKDTKYGCCPDGVSPAGGLHNEECPVPDCSETLYGCCKSDSKTAAEGNDQEGCPPPCKASKYGCCANNETQATGPHKAGCPETSTTTTESPTESTTDWDSTTDTGSTETGPTETTTEGTTESTTVGVCSVVNGTEVCQPCSEFEHGCCEDGKTPAHGPDRLGCCLLSPHGCCPDNSQAASGPKEEGCECKSSPFGCCPDNKSYARGANFSGCGCEQTPHGCCLDRHTEASGPNFEGCSCHTYQFGCCPDGETIAEGPNHQGCHCRDTTFRCCSDGITAATGPDQEGCDCASSQFGCCLDGVTKAQSTNFTGCADAPVNRQAACALPYDAGTDTNYTVQWYYDMQYGGCSRFHYGGRGGNGNRFADKAECEDVCVRPADKDVCQLPRVKGTCGNAVLRWYYDSHRGCVQFYYGGCLGNANNFETRELCERRCAPKLNQEEKCQQTLDRGPCAGNFSRWGYEAGQCKEFLWGGCEGNSNRFTSKAACTLQCNPPGEKKPECALTQDAGNCTEMIPYWSFDGHEERCVPIYYSGCGGNENRFPTQEKCEDSCPKSFVKDKCTLPVSSGECRNYRERWFYDTKNQQCRMFPYGGCGGNGNNFHSEAQCKAECARPATPPPAPRTPPAQPTPTPAASASCLLPTEPGTCAGREVRWTYSTDTSECIEFTYTGCGGNGNNFASKQSCEETCHPPKDICELPKDVGPCRAAHARWYFDTSSRRCQQFYFGGCRGNANNFVSEGECHSECELKQSTTTPLSETTKDVCSLPAKVGPCRAAIARYYFDAGAGRCGRFIYGGCQSNGNNFPSARACEQRCGAPAPTPAPVAPECRVSDLSQCVGVGRVWYLEPRSGACAAYEPARGPARCAVSGVFPSPEACERTCGLFKDLGNGDVCRAHMDIGSCNERQQKFYFDEASQTCQPFIYSGCTGSPNRFSSITECESVCMPDPCKLPRAAGNCTERTESWSYDESTDECTSFVYTGCNGNANRFESQEECEGQCKTGVPPPAPAPAPATRAPAPPTQASQLSTDSCTLPMAKGNCNQFLVSWYYDEASDSCGRFVYTGCNGNDNRFESQEDCEGLCKQGVEEPPTEHGAGTEPEMIEEQCRLPTSLEPCGVAEIAFYYDYTQDHCVSAPIGRCTDIPNRYNTEEECLRSCGEFRLQDVCHAPLDPGPCRTAQQKFYWNLRVGRCEEFTYGGCEGGPNRFSNMDDCEQVCGHLAIDPACGLPPAPGAACAGAGGGGGAPRWHRSALYGDCRLFVFYGCEGNGNNFLTKQECERHCSPPPGNGTNEVDCEPARRECAELRCQFGLTRTKAPNDECDRCSCDPDPCADIQCGSGQRCQLVPYRATANGDIKYTSQCRSDCSAERARCESLECEYTVQRTRGADNCEHCECVRPEPNCQPFVDECSSLKCHYGPITRTVDGDGCERCTCIAHPCEGKRCPEGQRCVVTASRNATSGEPQYSGDCQTMSKQGSCPAEQTASGSCHVGCNDDADCRGVQKCCRSGCSQLCRAPAPEQRPTMSLPPQAPQPDPATEHDVSSTEGGTATLRCLFHSNPPPQITWKKGEITIDGSQGRYKLTSDGALQIVSLYRDDSGVYICVAQNELGSTEQEITLRVDGPVNVTAGIIEESPSDLVGEISEPLRIRCLAYGHPQPHIWWFHGTDMVPYDSAEYEARGNTLLIRSLRIDTLGEYTCQVYNGPGPAVSRTVVVRAERRERSWPDSAYWLPRGAPPAPAPPAPPATPARTRVSSQPIVEYAPVPREYTVAVNTNIRATQTALATGGRLELACDVDGHPEPNVYWTKDNQRLAEGDRIYITPSRLSITQVAEEDAGEYGCNADNGYSSHRSSVQISVQKLYIPEQCKDNQYFATCTLIVRSHLCRHEYYSKFCCKTCVEAGELNPLELEFQADQSWTFKKK